MTADDVDRLEDEPLLAALAQALVDHPRATLQELARAIGVSKATLYRFCRTREQLIDRLMTHGAAVLRRAIAEATLDSGPVREGLRRLILSQLAHKELTAFLISYWKPDTVLDARAEASWQAWEDAVDAFFLRGQHEGQFKIGISAAALTEMLIWMLMGMVDAEHRGRVARASIADLVEQVFLSGAGT